MPVNAIVYPACSCGVPWALHRENPQCADPIDCKGYDPIRPVRDLGDVALTETLHQPVPGKD